MRALISALLTLVAWARAPHAEQKVLAGTPIKDLNFLVSLRVQLWLQELRRVVATVSRAPAGIELGSEAAVLSQRERLRLPLVQCRHCHTTGWLTLKQAQESRVVNSLEKIYGSFFSRYPDTFIARIYPRLDAPGRGAPPMAPLLSHTLCGQCGHLGNERLTQCPHCQSDDVVPVHVVSVAARGGRSRSTTTSAPCAASAEGS